MNGWMLDVPRPRPENAPNACYRFATGRVKLVQLATAGEIMPSLIVVGYVEANGHAREAELRATSDYYNGARVYREVLR